MSDLFFPIFAGYGKESRESIRRGKVLKQCSVSLIQVKVAQSLMKNSKEGLLHLDQKSETEVKQLIETVSYHYSLLPFRILKISQRMLMKFQANVDGNGTIDINEFISVTLDRFKLDHHELVRQEFQHFDKRKRWVNNKG